MAKAHEIKGINCYGAATPGIRAALKERFDEMYALRQDALNFKEPEGVHSMRVASRRLRSSLRSFMPYLNKGALTPALKEIKTIADALGTVRDQDVAILALENLSSKMPKEFLSPLERLIDSRKLSRETARHDLKKVLAKRRLKELSVQFELALESVAQHQATSTTPGNDQSYISVAKTIIRGRLTELEQLSDSLYFPSDNRPLHDLRIAAKRLRYAIELFSSCWEGKLELFAKRAARLQTDLGQLHDCDVWIESLEDKIGKSKTADGFESETLVWLFTHYQEQRNKYYRGAFSRWAKWRADNLSGKLRDLTQPRTEDEIKPSGSASASSSRLR